MNARTLVDILIHNAKSVVEIQQAELEGRCGLQSTAQAAINLEQSRQELLEYIRDWSANIADQEGFD